MSGHQDINIYKYKYGLGMHEKSLLLCVYVVAESLAWTSLAQRWIRAAACRGIVVARSVGNSP